MGKLDDMNQPGKRPTMHDVARRAGVSQSLVSIVFRGVSGASDDARKKVFKAAEDLGYYRDESARALRSTRPLNIGVTFQTRQPFHHELIDGLYAATSGTEHQLMLSAVSHSRDEGEAVASLLAHRVGAIIMLGPREKESRVEKIARHTPVISVARRFQSSLIDWVVSDDAGGMSQALDYLVDEGHQKIHYFSCATAAGGQDRLEAYQAAVENHGLSAVATWSEEGGMNERSGVQLAEKLLEGPIEQIPTALMTFNDRQALGVLEVFSRRGVAVPETVSLVGFDDSEIASRTSIDLTSVHQDTAQLAQVAANRAIGRLQEIVEGEEFVPQQIILPTTFKVRGSTGPARQQ